MAKQDWTLSGLRELLQFRLQNDPRFTSGFVDLAIRKAVVRLMLFIRNTTTIWDAETFVLTEGDYAGQYAMEYPLPDGTLWIDSISFDGQRPLQVLSQNELANTGIELGSNAGVGDPYACYVYDTPERTKVLVLWPRPGRVAPLQFYGGVEPDWTHNADGTTNESAIPPFREEYRDALEPYAIAYLIDGQEGMEAKYDQMINKWLKERAEAKINQGANRVFSTRRSRDFS